MGKSKTNKKGRRSKGSSPLGSPKKNTPQTKDQLTILNKLNSSNLAERDAALTAVSQLITNSSFPLSATALRTITQRAVDGDISCSLNAIGALNNLVQSSRMGEKVYDDLLNGCDLMTVVMEVFKAKVELLFGLGGQVKEDWNSLSALPLDGLDVFKDKTCVSVTKKYEYHCFVLDMALDLLCNLVEGSETAHKILLNRLNQDPSIYARVLQIACTPVARPIELALRININSLQEHCARLLHSSFGEDSSSSSSSSSSSLNEARLTDLPAIINLLKGRDEQKVIIDRVVSLALKAKLHLAGYCLGFVAGEECGEEEAGILEAILMPLASIMSWSPHSAVAVMGSVCAAEEAVRKEEEDAVMDTRALDDVRKSGISAIDIVRKHRKNKEGHSDETVGDCDHDMDGNGDGNSGIDTKNESLPPPPPPPLSRKNLRNGQCWSHPSRQLWKSRTTSSAWPTDARRRERK